MLNVYLLFYYAKCIPDQFHVCIQSMECEINEMKMKGGKTVGGYTVYNTINLHICICTCWLCLS